MKKIILALAASFTFTFDAKAQDGFENLLLAPQDDSEKLLQAYFSPLFEGFTSGMNNGWYHTAKVHKLFGFDVSIAANATFIPSEKETFANRAIERFWFPLPAARKFSINRFVPPMRLTGSAALSVETQK